MDPLIKHYDDNPTYASISWHDIIGAMKYFNINPLRYFRVLDLGCGDGRFGNNFQQCFDSSVTGMDYSKVRIDIAKQRYPNCTFIYGDIFDINETLVYYRYNLIIMFEVLEHLEKPEQFWKTLVPPALASVPKNMPYIAHRHVYKTKEDLAGFDCEILETDNNFFLWSE